MPHLHIDGFSGVAGDMLLGALVDAGLPFDALARGLKPVRSGEYRLRAARVRRGGIAATKVDVVISRGFGRALSLAQIDRTLAGARALPADVRERSREVFRRLAEAEGLAHGVKPAKVHFHEVGVVDSLVDVVGTVLGCHLLGAARITASPVNLGAGTVQTAHGRLPVPGPAVAALARRALVYSDGPQKELTTPTGLALVTVLAEQFGPLPLMRPSAVGYGAGTQEFEDWPNVLRLFVGEPVGGPNGAEDTIVQVETNLDDLNPQAYDAVMARLFDAGALDVTLAPVIMKQGRPGIVVSALAPRSGATAVADVLLRETTTLGVRMQEVRRLTLARRMETVTLHGAAVHIKVAELGNGSVKAAPEYRDCRKIADRIGRPVRDIMEEAMQAYRRGTSRTRRRARTNV